jgi:hypothetical protein
MRGESKRHVFDMRSTLRRATSVVMAVVAYHCGIGCARAQVDSWLDTTKPASWNKPGQRLPSAPKTREPIDLRCRALARPPELSEDKHVRDRGWDLVGDYHGGWQIVIVRGAAGYDGMCRPRVFQDFVFRRGVFAGTLSPQSMRSRTDGSLRRVSIENDRRLTAEFARYAATDPLCCPSQTTVVVFDLANDTPVVRPVSASTSPSK